MVSAVTNPSWSDDALEEGERLPVKVGDVAGGRYRIESILGTGPIAVVAAAVETRLGRRVALKVMRERRITPRTAERFLGEARSASRLASAHVVRVLDHGLFDEKTPYLAMELVEGRTLASILAKEGVLRPAVAVEYVLQISDALAEGHRLGLVHGRLSTSNVYLTHRPADGAPVIKILHFGLSPRGGVPALRTDAGGRIVDLDRERANAVLTMSPEQIREVLGDDGRGDASNGAERRLSVSKVTALVDGRSDIWSLGAILFELVCGHSPFAADRVAEIVTNIRQRPTPSVEPYLPNAPPGLSAVVQRCLEKDRGKRYLTAGALRRALEELDVKASISTFPAFTGSPESERQHEAKLATGSRPIAEVLREAEARQATKRPATKLLPTLILVLVLLALAAAGYALWRLLLIHG